MVELTRKARLREIIGLTHKQIREMEKVLFEKPTRLSKNHPTYKADFHNDDIIRYFLEALDDVEEPLKVELHNGDVKYVQQPVKLPTLAGYAVEIGVTRECLWEWSKQHTDFGVAYHRAKAIQEEILVQQALRGGYDRSCAIFVLKNLQSWQDKVEQVHKGDITLNFDAQDQNA